jgi:hypothetical protein
MRIDLKAIGIAYLVFLALYLPIYLQFTPYDFTKTISSNLTPWLPYLAIFFSGLVMAYYSSFNRRFNALLLTALIALSIGLANHFGPSDFPGFYGSVWVTGLSFPIVLFLVVAGLGAKNLIKVVSNEIKP